MQQDRKDNENEYSVEILEGKKHGQRRSGTKGNYFYIRETWYKAQCLPADMAASGPIPGFQTQCPQEARARTSPGCPSHCGERLPATL